MRDAFFDELYSIASADPNVLLLTDDQGAFGVERIKRDLEGQYFNVGIAEQNLVSVAAGLAMGGHRPFIYGISNFMTMRCLEQISVDLCGMNLPVTIIGSGAGYMYSSDGPTHHATQDMAILRTLPNMSILSPSDALMTTSFVRSAYEDPGPKYVRIEKGVLPDIYLEGDEFTTGFEVLELGNDLMIVSTGIMVGQAMQVADLLAEQSIDAGVIDLYRVKPIDVQMLLAAINGTTKVVTVEEHSIVGGIGSILSEINSDAGNPFKLHRIALPDKSAFRYGSRNWMHESAGLGKQDILKSIIGWLGDA